MKLPILLSVPHAGLVVPPEARPYCRLSIEEIIADGDEQAAEVYALEEHVVEVVRTNIARAIVDMNRPEGDDRPDGIIKTHTCWNVPVYDPSLPAEVGESLIERYHRPYHARLTDTMKRPDLLFAVDGHTMAAIGPPIAPDPGRVRPAICLGDRLGESFPPAWMELMVACFEEVFRLPVTVNDPFAGGHICRTHASGFPWVQIEFSRGDFATPQEKRSGLLAVLTEFCQRVT